MRLSVVDKLVRVIRLHLPRSILQIVSITPQT